MQDILEPELMDRIDRFLERKKNKYPELHRLDDWGQYKFKPHRRSYAETTKYFRMQRGS